MNQHYEKACLLAEQGRYSLAEKEVLAALAEEPNSDRAHNILSHCQSNQQRHDPAIASAQQAIALAPDDPFHYYRLACVYKAAGQYELAQKAIATSLQLDPNMAETYGIAAAIYQKQGKTAQMLAFADKGLALDPEHQTCWNMRVLALLIAERMQDAETEVVRLLQLYPDHAFSHSARGWVAIYRGKIAHSLEAFKSALQIDPNSEWARSGMMEALKAQNILYRGMLRYNLWQSRFRQSKPGVFWALWLMLPPVRSLYILMIFFSWGLSYLCDVALRFHPYGSLLFTAQEKAWNSGVALILGLFLAGLGLAIATQ
jgi:tetratricopeptide (TPR) repeat protein